MKKSEDAEFLKRLGQFALANYRMGSNENKGKPKAEDVTAVERARSALLEEVDI